MIGEKVGASLNLQMNREFYNAKLYLSMAAYFHSINMEGAAQWMEQQSREETGHAMRFYNYIQERGGRIILSEVEAPPIEWGNPLAAFEEAYKHERQESREIDEHLELARKEKDNAAINFLQWFVNEQVEEEASVDAVVQKIKMVKNAAGALFMIDRMLGERAKS